MKANPKYYTYPPRTSQCLPFKEAAFLGELGYIAQLKYNDTRTTVKILPNGQIELWNRHAERHRAYTPTEQIINELEQITQKLNLTDYSLLDGGLLHQKHCLLSNTIVLWDILIKNGQHLHNTTYKERYEQLHNIAEGDWTCEIPKIGQTKLGLKLTENIFIPENHPQETWEQLWERVHHINSPYTIGKPGSRNYEIKPLVEGMLFKEGEGRLEIAHGEKNNEHWQIKSRVHTGRHNF